MKWQKIKAALVIIISWLIALSMFYAVLLKFKVLYKF